MVINGNFLTAYAEFTDFTPTIPKFYWDVTSQEQRIKAICEEIGKIIKFADAQGIQINANTEDIKQLAEELANLKVNFADEFETFYKERIEEWLNAHLVDEVAEIVKFVDFGLTADGYFAARIPKSWDFLKFDTGLEYDNKETYGHLILEW